MFRMNACGARRIHINDQSFCTGPGQRNLPGCSAFPRPTGGWTCRRTYAGFSIEYIGMYAGGGGGGGVVEFDHWAQWAQLSTIEHNACAAVTIFRFRAAASLPVACHAARQGDHVPALRTIIILYILYLYDETLHITILNVSSVNHTTLW